MKKKSDYATEAEYYKDWYIAFIDFKLGLEDMPNEVKEIYEDSKKRISNIDLKDKRHARGIKEAFNSCKEEIGHWPDNMKADFNDVLYAKFGERYQNNEAHVNRIVKRGKINSDDEFRMVDYKVNELCQTNPDSPQIKELNNLLLAYEGRGTR